MKFSGRFPGLLLLALAVALVYWPVTGYRFINFDDETYILNNPGVLGGLSVEGLRWAFTPNTIAFWRPLTWITHQAEWQVFGAWAGGYHLVNVLLHLAAALLLAGVLRRMTGHRGVALLAAAVFALHPLSVEPAAWVAERKEVLAAVWWMLTMLAWLGYLRGPRPGRYALVLLFFVLGLLSKATLVVLPPLLLLLDWWPLGRTSPRLAGGPTPWKRLFLEKAPLAVLAILSAAVTIGTHPTIQRAVSFEHPLADRLSLVPVAYVTYLRRLVFPTGLTVFYPRPAPPGFVVLGACILLLAGLTWLGVRHRRRHPSLITGWAWFIVCILPVSQVVRMGNYFTADRYLYLAMIGPLLGVAWLVRRHLGGPTGHRAGALAFVILAALAGASSCQVRTWRDSETVFRHSLAVTRDNYTAHANLAAALGAGGRTEEAIGHLREALRLMPSHSPSWFNLGVALRRAGDAAGAEEAWSEAVRLDPGDYQAWVNLGLLLLETGRAAEAVGPLENALRLSPGGDTAFLLPLGLALEGAGRGEEALARYREKLRRDPSDAAARDRIRALAAD